MIERAAADGSGHREGTRVVGLVDAGAWAQFAAIPVASIPDGTPTRLCTLMADGRLDGQIELEGSWREPSVALDALLERRIGGKAVLYVN